MAVTNRNELAADLARALAGEEKVDPGTALGGLVVSAVLAIKWDPEAATEILQTANGELLAAAAKAIETR